MIADVAPGARVVLLDIEGTTTPIAFVHDTLFRFARERLDAHLTNHWESPDIQRIIDLLRRERAQDEQAAPTLDDTSDAARRQSVLAYLCWLMDRDRKSPALKELQGLIWEAGYQAGLLHGVVWDDVPRAMKRWRKAGLRVAIYSSGSELAQRRLFQSVPQGDLTPAIAAFFDTRVGGKLLPESYERIAASLGVGPREVCFVSDVTRELVAARTAGCSAVLSVRPGNPPQPDADAFPVVTSFDEL